MAKKQTINISELQQDDKNFNKGSALGESLIKKSFEKFGAGRSILIDKNNRIISGNKTSEGFQSIGGENVLVVETDGKTLIAVKRNDIDLDTPEGREMALADNAAAKMNIVWDAEVIAETVDPEVIESWAVDVKLDEDYSDEFELPEGEKPPFEQITFTVSTQQAQQIRTGIERVKKTEEYKYCEWFGNENSNGNALYLIIMQWLGQKK